MQRNRALALAGAAVASVAAATGAIAANVGLLGFSDGDARPTGQLQADEIVQLETPTSTTLPDIVVTVDESGTVTASSVPGTTAGDDGTLDQGSGDVPPAAFYEDEPEYEDEEHESEEYEDDEHESEEHEDEYEGEEDDD